MTQASHARYRIAPWQIGRPDFSAGHLGTAPFEAILKGGAGTSHDAVALQDLVLRIVNQMSEMRHFEPQFEETREILPPSLGYQHIRSLPVQLEMVGRLPPGKIYED